MIIQDTLHALGITRNYRGFRRSAIAIRLVLENPERLENVTRDVYRIVADTCGCNSAAVERNLRTVVERAWRISPTLLRYMAGYPLACPPTVSEFLEIVSNYIRKINTSETAFPRNIPPFELSQNKLPAPLLR